MKIQKIKEDEIHRADTLIHVMESSSQWEGEAASLKRERSVRLAMTNCL